MRQTDKKKSILKLTDFKRGIGKKVKTEMLKENKSEGQRRTKLVKSSEKKARKNFKIKRKKRKTREKENEKMSIHSANSGNKKMKREKESMTCSNFYKGKERKTGKGAAGRKFIVR